jgi:hypothetical protein
VNKTHSVSQILGREDTAQTLLVIHNEHTVRALGRTELTSLRNRDVFRNGECRTWLQGRDSALGCRLLLAATAAVVIRRGNGSLTCQLALDLLAYRLYVHVHERRVVRTSIGYTPRPASTVSSSSPRGRDRTTSTW